MRIIMFVISLLALSLCTEAQNAYDAAGRKTGPWKVYYPDDGPLRYEAVFSMGKPVGRMKRYNEKGGLVANLNFYPGSDRCHAEMYHTNGRLKAVGVYHDQKKDSVWLYFGTDETLRMRETYENGVLSGPSATYYETGNPARMVSYSSGKREGTWLRLYENGDTMQIATYEEGELHGAFTSFNPDGEAEVTGRYFKGTLDGDWVYYDSEGELKKTLHYDRGTLLNPEELEKSYEDFIRHIEENMNNMPDPAVDL